MTQEAFKLQMQRLIDCYGERSYPTERVKLIYNAIKKLPDLWLENAVSYFIGNNRQAPMLKEFNDEALDYEKRSRENSAIGNFSNPLEYMFKAAKYVPNAEFAQESLKLLRKKLSGEITKAQFAEGCDLLDQAAKLCEGGGRL